MRKVVAVISGCCGVFGVVAKNWTGDQESKVIIFSTQHESLIEEK